MALKLLDIDYLRAQNTSNGQVLVTSSTFGIQAASELVIRSNRVGIGSSTPSHKLSVTGNVSVSGPSSGYIFADGSSQSTAAVTMPPGGTSGSVQYNDSGEFGGSANLFWDSTSQRLGIGTTVPRSTLQIRDVGYESTDTNTSGTATVVLDSFPATHYRSCHYIVQVTDETYSWFHTTQIMLVHDGLSAFKSEYNIVTTSEKLGEFDCNINGGNVELTFSAFYTSSKNIKVIRTSIEP